MTMPQVTIVIVPRERFSYTKQSLESVYQNTELPFKLIYVDGNSPHEIKSYLQAQSEDKGFQLIRRDTYLSPNQARNLSIANIDTPYVAFLDNDVLVRPGWLKALVNCAEETGAWVVGPLCLQGEDFATIHQVGGEITFRECNGQRWLIERRPFMGLPLTKLKTPLKREQTELVEFHCNLMRTDLFTKIGPLDEKLMSMAEETDLGLMVREAGGSTYCEPNSVISYVPPYKLDSSDLPFFFIRWSEAWCETSIQHMQQKWQLSQEAPIFKTYRHFVYDHRQMAFGDRNELPLKKLVTASDLSINQKISYLSKKILRRSMNQRASQLALPFTG